MAGITASGGVTDLSGKTTDDLTESATKLYMSPAQETKLSNVETAAQRDKNHNARVVRNSTTQLQVEAVDAARNTLEINGETVTLGTKTCDVSGGSEKNLLAADGSDSGGAPSASTLYYIYRSNTQPAFGDDDVYLSATAPTDGYLGSSGDAAHWRFVGSVYLDGSTEIAAEHNICGFQPTFNESIDTTGVTRAAGTSSTFYEYSALTLNHVVLLDNMIIDYRVKYVVESDNASATPAGRIKKDTVVKDKVVLGAPGANKKAQINLYHGFKSSSVQEIDLSAEYYYYASGDSLTIAADNQAKYQLWRIPT